MERNKSFVCSSCSRKEKSVHRMFFFFAGGVEQQVRQVVKRGAGRCLLCGGEANLVEYDKVLKVFFVPTWKWPAKSPAINCESCNLFFPDSLRCRFCDRLVDRDSRFCPFCGTSL